MEKCIIFDVDGTLNQTDLYAVKAYRKALEKRGIIVSNELIISCIGLSPEAIIEKLFCKGLSQKEWESWKQDIQQYEYELMKNYAKAFEGTKETLMTLKHRGYKLAICSNAYKEHVENVLKAIHLEEIFENIGTLELGKTKTIVLQKLLLLLGNPKACMVGDRTFDIEAAQYNNIPFIGCAYGYARQEIQNADYIIKQPKEILEIIDKLL